MPTDNQKGPGTALTSNMGRGASKLRGVAILPFDAVLVASAAFRRWWERVTDVAALRAEMRTHLERAEVRTIQGLLQVGAKGEEHWQVGRWELLVMLDEIADLRGPKARMAVRKRFERRLTDLVERHNTAARDALTTDEAAAGAPETPPSPTDG